MTIFWGLILGVPLLAFGGLGLCSPPKAKAAAARFSSSRAAAAVLSAAAWAWTAYECDTIGIDVFNMILKRFPGEVWILAAVLAWLTVIWMPKNLPVRALMGVFMLVPAELFKATRPLLPDSGFAPVTILVILGYVLAVIGMYGMFYPWRIERALDRILSNAKAARAFGAALAAFGAAAIVAGFVA